MNQIDSRLQNRVLLCGVGFLVVMSGLLSPVSAAQRESEVNRPRVIATTDGEVDDRCSMVRFLLYANEWDIQGIIHSSSKFHWKGDDSHEEKDWKPVVWLDEQLDAYAEVYPSLQQHDPNYPSLEYLRSQVFVGNIACEGDISKPTPGSDRIVQILLEPDDSPVWLQAWGGSNTIARALKTIQEDYPEKIEEIKKKARLFLIARQDNTLDTYIRPEWPGLQVLLSDWASFGVIAYSWKEDLPEDVGAYFEKEWMTSNILQGHGPLCSMYEAKEERFRSEGDTPSFLHVINTGLCSNEHPSYGGWGGRFGFKKGVWISVDKRDTPVHSVARWAKDFQNDWAARADWCVNAYADANHPPRVLFTHANELAGKSGESLDLDGSPSSDPDGNTLQFNWWSYTEAGSYNHPVTIKNSQEAKTTFVIPEDAKPDDTIHIVCTVTDFGEPKLTRYARVIVKVVE